MKLLRPHRFKYKKVHRNLNLLSGIEVKTSQLQLGCFGIKALEAGKLTPQQIEAVRKVLRKRLKKHGKIWICTYPAIPLTKKSLGLRMGKGKGAYDTCVSYIKPGKILFELYGVPELLAKDAIELASIKLPMRIKMEKYRK